MADICLHCQFLNLSGCSFFSAMMGCFKCFSGNSRSLITYGHACRYGIGKAVRGETKLGVNIMETSVAEKANCR